jgi:hypothetical protein
MASTNTPAGASAGCLGTLHVETYHTAKGLLVIWFSSCWVGLQMQLDWSLKVGTKVQQQQQQSTWPYLMACRDDDQRLELLWFNVRDNVTLRWPQALAGTREYSTLWEQKRHRRVTLLLKARLVQTSCNLSLCRSGLHHSCAVLSHRPVSSIAVRNERTCEALLLLSCSLPAGLLTIFFVIL